MSDETEKRYLVEDACLTTLIDSINVGVLLHDTAHNTLNLNRAFLDMFAVSANQNDLIGKPITSLYAPAAVTFKEQYKSDMRGYQLLANKEPAFGDVYETTDGKFVRRDFIPVVLDNEVVAFLWLFYYTERPNNGETNA